MAKETYRCTGIPDTRSPMAAQAAASTTPRSPGKQGPARHATVSVLRRPGDREGKRQRDSDRDTEVEPSVGAPEDRIIPSPEAEIEEGEQSEEHQFGGPIRDLPPVGHSTTHQHGNGEHNNNASPPPPSPTPLERGENAPAVAERQQQQQEEEGEGYRVSADLHAESDSEHDDEGDESEGGRKMQAEEEEEEDALDDAVVAEADEDLAGGGGRLVQEV